MLASDVKANVHYQSQLLGGQGCVREIVEQILRVQSKWNIEAGLSLVALRCGGLSYLFELLRYRLKVSYFTNLMVAVPFSEMILKK